MYRVSILNKSQLRRWGYSGAFIENQLQEVDKLERFELLSHSNESKEAIERIPLVLTFSSFLQNMHAIVYKHLHVLYQSERMEEVFAEPVAYKMLSRLQTTDQRLR